MTNNCLDINVIESPQEPRKLAEGWIIYEGDEVFRNRTDIRKNKPLKKLNSISIGDSVYIRCFGMGIRSYKKSKIVTKDKDEAQAEIIKDCFYADLKFSRDNRKCWASTGLVSYRTKGILKAYLNIDESV